MKDPIVAEVRKHRMQHTRKFNYDLLAICADLQSLQKKSGHKIVRLASRKLVPGTRVVKRAGNAK
jgi:hypothetical protein